MRILIKYLYSVILLGSILLAGCSANEKTEEQVPAKEDKTEDSANRQEVNVQPLSDSVNELVLKTPLELTHIQKESYYKQYTTIIEDTNSEFPDADLELVPFEEFKSEEWVKPDEFRLIAIDMATQEWEMVR